MKLLEGKVAIITGGGSGIGRATARLFVEEGAQVVIADIQDDKGQSVAEELGSNAIFQHTNVRREPDIKAMIGLAVTHFGRLDCLFNNAGYGGVAGPIEETSIRGFDKTVSVLLRGVFMGIKHAAPVMKKQGSGSIISTGSVAGLRTGYGPHVYSACKAAVIHLTRTTAMELGPHNIRVNCICPGGIATPIFAPVLDLAPEESDKAYQLMTEKLAGGQPIHRAGQPEDIAHAALYLASDHATFVNGHALVVDGGLIGGQKWDRSWIAREGLTSDEDIREKGGKKE